MSDNEQPDATTKTEAQDEYDRSPELRRLLAEAIASPMVRHVRRPRRTT